MIFRRKRSSGTNHAVPGEYATKARPAIRPTARPIGMNTTDCMTASRGGKTISGSGSDSETGMLWHPRSGSTNVMLGEIPTVEEKVLTTPPYRAELGLHPNVVRLRNSSSNVRRLSRTFERLCNPGSQRFSGGRQ